MRWDIYCSFLTIPYPANHNFITLADFYKQKLTAMSNQLWELLSCPTYCVNNIIHLLPTIKSGWQEEIQTICSQPLHRNTFNLCRSCSKECDILCRIAIIIYFQLNQQKGQENCTLNFVFFLCKWLGCLVFGICTHARKICTILDFCHRLHSNGIFYYSDLDHALS